MLTLITDPIRTLENERVAANDSEIPEGGRPTPAVVIEFGGSYEMRNSRIRERDTRVAVAALLEWGRRSDQMLIDRPAVEQYLMHAIIEELQVNRSYDIDTHVYGAAEYFARTLTAHLIQEVGYFRLPSPDEISHHITPEERSFLWLMYYPEVIRTSPDESTRSGEEALEDLLELVRNNYADMGDRWSSMSEVADDEALRENLSDLTERFAAIALLIWPLRDLIPQELQHITKHQFTSGTIIPFSPRVNQEI